MGYALEMKKPAAAGFSSCESAGIGHSIQAGRRIT
jgi:hypothetical protein